MNEFTVSSRLIEVLAKTNNTLNEFAIQLELTSDFSKVERSMDCRFYQEKLILQMYVEATLKNNDAICFWIEMENKADKWEIEAIILFTDDLGQKSITNFPVAEAQTLNQLEYAFKTLSNQLLQHEIF